MGKTKIPKHEAAPWEVNAHRASLGEQFARCVQCRGTTGKVVDGKMGCARGGAAVVWLSPAQAQSCDGIKPVVPKPDAWPLKSAVQRVRFVSA